MRKGKVCRILTTDDWELYHVIPTVGLFHVSVVGIELCTVVTSEIRDRRGKIFLISQVNVSTIGNRFKIDSVLA